MKLPTERPDVLSVEVLQLLEEHDPDCRRLYRMEEEAGNVHTEDSVAMRHVRSAEGKYGSWLGDIFLC